MSEMNSPTSSKIPSTDPWICMESRSFPLQSAGMVELWKDRDVQDRGDAQGCATAWAGAAGFSPGAEERTLPTLHEQKRARRWDPAVCPSDPANLDILEASAGLLLSMEEGFWERFLLEQVCW